MNTNITSTITVLLLLLLSGCATTSTPDLVEQAQLTGDWSAVDARFETLDRAADQTKMMCPNGTKPWCVNSTGKETCSCVEDTMVRNRLTSLWNR